MMPDLQYVQDLIKLCRKNGVKVVKVGDMELTLSDTPPKSRRKSESVPPPEEEQLTEEELMFYSVG